MQLFNTDVFKKIKNKQNSKALYYSFFEGMMWALMFGFAENYIIPFALTFGATVFQVSLISGSNQIGIGLGQLIGAKIINDFLIKRKKFISICNIIHSISWLLILLVAFTTRNVYFIILIFFINILSFSFAGPPWLSWMNELIQDNVRGEYWGLRNRFLGIAQFVAISIAGIFLYNLKNINMEQTAYIILFSLAFLIRLTSIYILNKQHEPQIILPSKDKMFKFKIFLTKLRTSNFGRFALFSVFITFSVNLMGPLIPVMLLQKLNFNYIEYMIIIMTSQIFTFLFMTYWGPLTDKYGNYRIMFITAVFIPLISLGWIFITNLYLLCLLQLFSGFVWSGFNLSTVNFIFDAVRKENITKIMAYFNALNNFFAFIGSVLGGILASLFVFFKLNYFFIDKFIFVFAVSFIFRTIAVLLFIKKFKEVRSVEESPSIKYFYIYKPFSDMVERIQTLNYKIFKKNK